MPKIRAVTFDFGQTLAALDENFLSMRLAERGLRVPAKAIESALPAAWEEYNRQVQRKNGRAWHAFMRALLSSSGVPSNAVDEMVEYFWREQPRHNLWRRPLPPMLELVKTLHRLDVPMAIVSNSEGHLSELVSHLGWESFFVAVADSGKLGVEKPNPAIFHWTASQLGIPAEAIAHVGDSYAADVQGALAAGMRAVWLTDAPSALEENDSRVRACVDAEGVRQSLFEWGLTAKASP